MNKERNKRLLICIFVTIILVILDQLTKSWAVGRLKDNSSIDIIKGALELYYLPNGNTGAAFGMLQGHQTLFMIIAIIICSVLFYIIYNMPYEKKYSYLLIAMVLIISGGIGNMIDRIRLNYVVDFIYFSLINFPVFNVADSYVSIGTVLLVILILFYYKEDDLKNIENCLKLNKMDTK